MERFLAAQAPWIQGILRIVLGLNFAGHGAQKILGLFGGAGGSGQTIAFADNPQLWLGGVIELAAGILFAAGLLTRYVAVLCSGMMAVAYIQFHWIASGQFFPILNKGELALIYCFVFLLFAAIGPGALAAERGLARAD